MILQIIDGEDISVLPHLIQERSFSYFQSCKLQILNELMIATVGKVVLSNDICLYPCSGLRPPSFHIDIIMNCECSRIIIMIHFQLRTCWKCLLQNQEDPDIICCMILMIKVGKACQWVVGLVSIIIMGLYSTKHLGFKAYKTAFHLRFQTTCRYHWHSHQRALQFQVSSPTPSHTLHNNQTGKGGVLCTDGFICLMGSTFN